MMTHGAAWAEVMPGDCLASLRSLPDQMFQSCITSPPYFGLRDYGMAGQMGLEPTPDEYVRGMVEVFSEVRRTLRDDGTLWLNLGDSYAANRGYQVPSTLMNGDATNAAQAGDGRGMLASELGLKPKDLIGIPWRVAFALQADGWYLRQDIIWHKPNPMPESVTDRCTKAHEYIFLLSKSEKYYFDSVAIKEPAVAPNSGTNWAIRKANGESTHHGLQGAAACKSGGWQVGTHRNRRSVWTVTTKPYRGAHFATFPPDLIEPCILAGSAPGGIVLDPFGGSGTTAGVALRNGRNAILLELNPSYIVLMAARVASLCS